MKIREDGFRRWRGFAYPHPAKSKKCGGVDGRTDGKRRLALRPS